MRMVQNREQGAVVERWVGELLRRVHGDVVVIGGQHGGCVPDSVGYDIMADGTPYEVKSCMERVRRSSVAEGTRPGRWKVDTHAHDGIHRDIAERLMYVLVVCDEAGPKHAYLASHARMTGILSGYRRQGRFVSLTTSVWAPRLHRIYARRRRA